MFKFLILQKVIKRGNFFILQSRLNNLLLNLFCLKYFQFYRYNLLTTISCVDFPELENRFEINYHLLSLDYNKYLILRIKCSEFQQVESLSFLFKSAVWLEREVWDMFGVFFKNNYDLRRLLTDYGYPYHPLRKTFPLQGYSSIYYDLKKKKNFIYFKFFFSKKKREKFFK